MSVLTSDKRASKTNKQSSWRWQAPFYNTMSNMSRRYKNHESTCTSNVWKYRTKIKRVINNSVIVVEDLNASLLIMDRTTRQRSNMEIKDLNNFINQQYLTDIYRAQYPKIAEYMFTSNANGVLFIYKIF